MTTARPVGAGKKEGIAVVGIAAVACAACCAGPVIGFIAALGIGTGLAVAVFGVGGFVVAALGALWLMRRHQARSQCATGDRTADTRAGMDADGAGTGDDRCNAVTPVMVAAPTLRTRR